jgi:hypothetical protein
MLCANVCISLSLPAAAPPVSLKRPAREAAMKCELGNFIRGSHLIEQFGFMFAAGPQRPADHLPDRHVLDDLVDHFGRYVRPRSRPCVDARLPEVIARVGLKRSSI